MSLEWADALKPTNFIGECRWTVEETSKVAVSVYKTEKFQSHPINCGEDILGIITT